MWTWPAAMSTRDPGTQRVELAVGDATLALRPGEVRDFIRLSCRLLAEPARPTARRQRAPEVEGIAARPESGGVRQAGRLAEPLADVAGHGARRCRTTAPVPPSSRHQRSRLTETSGLAVFSSRTRPEEASARSTARYSSSKSDSW